MCEYCEKGKGITVATTKATIFNYLKESVINFIDFRFEILLFVLQVWYYMGIKG